MTIVSRKIRSRVRIAKFCLNCGSLFDIPPSRDWREHCCSSECKRDVRAKEMERRMESRRRKCELCSVEFFPRQNQIDNGQGRFCSLDCSVKNMVVVAHTEEANARRTQSVRLAVAEGRLVHLSGSDHPQWKGGPKETMRRRVESGRANEYTKRYRRENPDKVKEFSHRRKGRKMGRLPYGTIPKLRELQKNRCAICRVSLKGGKHLDHIVPLAKGGAHEPNNLQLLCPSCNVRKAAKDPIDYMQESGYLL